MCVVSVCEIKKKIFSVAFVMCCWKLKQAEFSNAELDRAKGTTAKPDHLYKEEAKGEKIPTISFGKRRERRIKLPVKPQKAL